MQGLHQRRSCDPNGRVLFGLIVTFKNELLKSYGEALDFLYQNGLNVFYGEKISDVDVPLDLIESVLLSSTTLKKKYTIDDFMTSFLIWRELLPGSKSRPVFPIPPCCGIVQRQRVAPTR